MERLKEKEILRIPEDDYTDWLVRETELVMQYNQALAVYPKRKKKTV